MKRTDLFRIIAILSLPSATSIPELFAACNGDLSFIPHSSLSSICNWEKGNGRCDEDSDCCPGRTCSALGFCEGI